MMVDLPKLTNANDPLEWAASRFPQAPAVRCGHERLTYFELDERARALSQKLINRGVSPGEIIAIRDLSACDSIVLFWACWLAQIICFPMNSRFPLPAVQDFLNEVNPVLIISQREIPGWKSTTVDRILTAGTSSLPELPAYDDKSPATLLMTSGSSGRSKFVLHTLKNHFSAAEASNRNISLVPGDAWMLNLPLYHVGGLAVLFRTLIAGATIHVPLDQANLVQDLHAGQVTHLSLVATQLHRLLQHPEGPAALTKLKAILLGGSAMPVELLKKALSLDLPIHTSYGSSEMASQITTTSSENREAALTCSGRPLNGVDLIISHQGEILVKGESLALAYLEAGERITLTDEDSWFHTGDVGFLNVRGELTVTGRLDNQFISGGENIQPEHIEASLTRQPGIRQAIVVPIPDPTWGARPVALLEISDHGINLESLEQALRQELPGYMIPSAYYRLSSSQLDTGGLKLSREYLKSLLLSGNNPLQSL